MMRFNMDKIGLKQCLLMGHMHVRWHTRMLAWRQRACSACMPCITGANEYDIGAKCIQASCSLLLGPFEQPRTPAHHLPQASATYASA